MFSFFDAIISLISVVVEFVINGFEFLIAFFTGLYTYFELSMYYISVLPEFIMVPAIICLAVVIGLQVFNKGS